MRHRVYGKHFSRTKNQRTALFKGLVRSLFLHESITTTAAKSKAIKGLADRLVAKGKSGSNASLKFIHATLPDKQVREKLIKEIAPRFGDRNSGFTQVVRLGIRPGDGAMMVKMSLVDENKKESKSQRVKESNKETQIDLNSVTPHDSSLKGDDSKKAQRKTAKKEKK